MHLKKRCFFLSFRHFLVECINIDCKVRRCMMTRSVHTSKRYAARQRETVTCLRHNGINKAGFSPGRKMEEASLLVLRPSSHCVILTSQELTSPVYYVCYLSWIVQIEHGALRFSIQNLLNGEGRLNGHSVSYTRHPVFKDAQ